MLRNTCPASMHQSRKFIVTHDAQRSKLISEYSCMALTMVLVVILTVYFRTMNRKADRGEVIIEDLASFRYTL